MKYQRETVEGIEVEILPLLQEHYREISPYPDLPLEPDFEVFTNAFNLGMLRIFSARADDGGLVGYAVFFLKTHQHYRKSKQATLELLYIDPNFRGDGASFIRYLEEELRSEGAEMIHFVVTEKLDYSSLLKRFGYWPNETTYTKRFDQ